MSDGSGHGGLHMGRELKGGIFFLAVSLLVMVESIRVELGTFREPGAGFLSFWVGTILCVLSLVLIYRGFRVRETQVPHARRVILALAALFAYSFALSRAGFVTATFFLVMILFQLGQSRRWWWLLGMSGLVTFLAYFIFGVLLHVYFPRGILGI